MDFAFLNLPLALRKNIEEIIPLLDEKEKEALRERFGEKNISLALFFRTSLEELLKEVPFSSLTIYHRWKEGRTFSIEEILCQGKKVKIFLCKEELNGKRVVAKWFRQEGRTVEEESSIYKKLKSLSCPLPYFSTRYRVWNEPLLLLEKLQPLGENEDYLRLGREILEQLEFLHNFGVHSDIKVNNIMKRGEKYFLIDYGGVACKPFLYGYLRWTWSEKWTCQKFHAKKQVTTAKHDFIELGYTMNALENLSLQGSYGNVREGFRGKIKEYMDYVRGLREESVIKQDYQQLKQILG